MKLLPLALSIFLLACNQKDCGNNKFLQNLSPTDNKKILGYWRMCSTFRDGMMIQANVCPTISFEINGRGYVNKNSVKPESFWWILKNDTLKISYSKNDSIRTFPDSVYSATFSQEKNYLKLFIENKTSIYYLSK
jgi:hypothetical protein